MPAFYQIALRIQSCARFLVVVEAAAWQRLEADGTLPRCGWRRVPTDRVPTDRVPTDRVPTGFATRFLVTYARMALLSGWIKKSGRQQLITAGALPVGLIIEEAHHLSLPPGIPHHRVLYASMC